MRVVLAGDFPVTRKRVSEQSRTLRLSGQYCCQLGWYRETKFFVPSRMKNFFLFGKKLYYAQKVGAPVPVEWAAPAVK